MKSVITEDWISYLHNTRKKEIKVIFSKFPKNIFRVGLELGAGDGFQSRLLKKYVLNLISTDINPEITKNLNNSSIKYQRIDAEDLDNSFKEKEFDLIFSSNLLEHLFNPNKVLNSINKILKDDGITIHIIPNPFYKICKLLLNIPYNLLIILNAFTEMQGIKKLIKEPEKFIITNRMDIYHNVNPKLKRHSKSRFYRFFIPEPHGISSNNIKEIYAFSRSRWKKEFRKANFKIIKIMNGPFSTGYGFKLNKLRNILERLGISLEYIYIAIKKEQKSAYIEYI